MPIKIVFVAAVAVAVAIASVADFTATIEVDADTFAQQWIKMETSIRTTISQMIRHNIPLLLYPSSRYISISKNKIPINPYKLFILVFPEFVVLLIL